MELAHVRGANRTGYSVLGQMVTGSSSSSSLSCAEPYYAAFAACWQRLVAMRRFGFPVGGGAVGYRPVITTLSAKVRWMFVTTVSSRPIVVTYGFLPHRISMVSARFSHLTSLAGRVRHYGQVAAPERRWWHWNGGGIGGGGGNRQAGF